MADEKKKSSKSRRRRRSREEEEEVESAKRAKVEESDGDDDEEYGPKPPVATQGGRANYGQALRPGEGAAIAQFVQKNLRVPRRGEVGWQGEEIERLESVGYVMSGSRHARMNAVRERKEKQVLSAEEKRTMALVAFEEKQQQENKLMADYRAMLQERLKKK